MIGIHEAEYVFIGAMLALCVIAALNWLWRPGR